MSDDIKRVAKSRADHLPGETPAGAWTTAA